MPRSHAPNNRNAVDGLRQNAVVKTIVAALIVTAALVGCASNRKATVSDLRYCDDKQGVEYYRGYANRVAYPCIDNQTAEAVAISDEPRNLRRKIEDLPREISLHEAMQIALTHNQVIETSALGGIGSKGILTNPTTAASVYDPAIQSSGVLFGRRSVESALADFDTTFTTNLLWSRNDLNGSSTAGGGNRADFTSSLRKQFATGGSVGLHHDWTHTVDPSTVNGATPNYFGRLGLEFRQPLLAGSGVEYTRIAGPANPNFGAITGVSQGVVIARINEDVSIANFQLAVRDALRDISDAYWVLYFAFRSYDTAVVAQKSAHQTWWETNERLKFGLADLADELQVRDRLYETKATVETNLNTLFKAEAELRRLIGLPMNDGTYLTPSDEPVMAEIIPDWRGSLQEGLMNRVELRRQKWAVKSLQLQLQAARSLVRPRFDFIAGYDVHGLGDTLLSQTQRPFGNAYRAMGTADTNSWNAGFQISVPIGQRFSRSQVRNLELQVTKAHAVLASQEKNIAHDIATAIQDLTATWAASQSNVKRLQSATERLKLMKFKKKIESGTLDLVLRAQASQASAANAYYQQIVDYNKAIMQLQFAKGTLLQDNGIYLAEGQWEPEAYCDALLRATARTHAKDAPRLQTAPAEFASPGPTGTVDLQTPIRIEGPSVEPVEIQPPLTKDDDGKQTFVPLPPESEKTARFDQSQNSDHAPGIPPRAAFAEPEPIFDPFQDYDRNPPRSASKKNLDFPSIDAILK